MKFCSCKCCGAVSALLIAILVGACMHASANWKTPFLDLPTETELAAIGGRYFKRPSDGRKMEYFMYGAEEAKTAFVMFHGSTISGYMFSQWQKEQISQTLDEKLGGDYMFICPSFDGAGATEPSESDDVVEIAHNFVADVTALLKSKGVSEVYTLGVSFGHEFVFMMGQHILQEPNMKLKGVHSISGMMWASDGTEVVDEDTHADRAIWEQLMAKLFLQPATLAPAILYMYKPYVESLGPEGEGLDASFPAEDLERAKRFDPSGALLKLQGVDMYRGVQYFPTGLVLQTLLSTDSSNPRWTDYRGVFGGTDNDFKIMLIWGTEENMIADATIDKLKQMMPGAEFLTAEGTGHIEVDIHAAVKRLLS